MAATHSSPDGDLDESRDLQIMDTDSGIGSDIRSDDNNDAILHATDSNTNDLRIESGTHAPVEKQVSLEEKKQPPKPPEGFDAVFSVDEQKKICDRMSDRTPHRAVWTELMRESKKRSKARGKEQSEKQSYEKSQMQSKKVSKKQRKSKSKSKKQDEEDEEYFKITHGLGREFTEAEVHDLAGESLFSKHMFQN